MVVMSLDKRRKSWIKLADDVKKDDVFKHWGCLLILGKNKVVFVLDDISSFTKIVGNDCAVLVVKADRGLVMVWFYIKDVEEMDPLLLDVVITSKSVVDPLNAGRMTDNRDVLTFRDTFAND